MFERNSAYSGDKTSIAVNLVMEDGEALKGHVLTRRGRDLLDILNGKERFLEFVSYKGDHSFIARQSIRNVGKIEEPGVADHLLEQFKNMGAFNPYNILGIAHTATSEDIKLAYRNLQHAYHPDKYSESGLPSEVVQYLIAMTKRINTAYEEIS